MKKAFDRKKRIFTLGILFTVFFVILAIFAEYLTPYDPVKMDMAQKFIPPGLQHPFGTDHMGRDILSRVILGSRVSLVTAASAVLISAAIGTVLGMVSGYV